MSLLLFGGHGKRCRHDCGCHRARKVIFHKIISGTLTVHEDNKRLHPLCTSQCNIHRNGPIRRKKRNHPRPLSVPKSSSSSSSSSSWVSPSSWRSWVMRNSLEYVHHYSSSSSSPSVVSPWTRLIQHSSIDFLCFYHPHHRRRIGQPRDIGLT